MDASEKYNATVVAKHMLTPDLFILKVKPDEPVSQFVSGQYMLLGLSSDVPRREGSAPEFKEAKPGRIVLRAYSIASPGYQTDMLEFYVSVVTNGSLTPRLVLLSPGDRLMVGDKIRGFFTLESVAPSHKTVVMAATGTGLAPYLSMMRQEIAAETRHDFRFILIHGAPHSWELGYLDEFRLLEKALPNLTYVPSITRTHEDKWWTGPFGRITGYFKDDAFAEKFSVPLDPAQTSVFLCGNPLMIEEVTHLLQPRGYTVHTLQEPGSLHTEEYW